MNIEIELKFSSDIFAHLSSSECVSNAGASSPFLFTHMPYIMPQIYAANFSEIQTHELLCAGETHTSIFYPDCVTFICSFYFMMCA